MALTPEPSEAADAERHHDGSERQVEIDVGLSSVVYRTLRFVLHVICRVYWRVEVEHEASVPKTGPVLLAPVHRSFIDFIVVTEVTDRKIFIMAKDNLWRSKLLGRLLESVGAFPINRDAAGDRLALDRAQSVLERGNVLILFPEGTRRSGPMVEDLHEGAAFLAARSGAQIVPIGIGGTEEAMRKGGKFARPVKVHLVVGTPIPAPERSERGRVPRSVVRDLTERLRADLQRLSDRARQIPTGPGV
jgi:1-acyl-sn-glycerol-3-phosphate acyltransferase